MKELALLLLTAIGGGGIAPSGDDINLTSADGTRLAAVWSAPARPAPAVLLVHMLTRSHRDWNALSDELHRAGFGVLAIDLRGHGASGGSRTDLKGMAGDVRAAVRWLEMRPDVLPSRIGIAGASLGATLALIVAADDPSVRSLALLSLALDYRGVSAHAALRQFDERAGPALLIAAAGDPYAVRCSREAGDATRGVRDVRVLEGPTAHGSQLLRVRPELTWQLVDWFRRTLL
jgi:alpha-beta hydrolase superfamily lysophospholipase